jgi:hypothetical protein
MKNYLIHVGDQVECEGQVWQVVGGPIMGTQGSLFDIQRGEDVRRGKWDWELKKVFADDVR